MSRRTKAQMQDERERARAFTECSECGHYQVAHLAGKGCKGTVRRDGKYASCNHLEFRE